MYRVLLVSLVNWDSLIEIPALLKIGGCTVDIYSIKNSWALQNKFYDQWIPASEDQGLFVKQLIEYVEGNGHSYNWIIPGDDAIIRLLNDARLTEALFYKIMPLTNVENSALLGSKAGFSTLCSKYNIQTPRYLIYNESLSPSEIGKYMGYPFLVKLDKSEGGFGVFMCESESDLQSNLAKAQNRNNLIFQQFIRGYDVNVEALYRGSELMVYSYSRTLTVMGKFGVSTQRLFYNNKEIEAEMRKIGKSLGLNGFCNIVFMYSEPEQKHYLIEVDVRPNAWMYYGKFLGNSFSEGVKKIINQDLTLVKPAEGSNGNPLKISLYKKDVYRCLMEKDIKGLAAWLINKDGRWRYIPFYDGKLLRACNRYLASAFWDLFTNKIKKITGSR